MHQTGNKNTYIITN